MCHQFQLFQDGSQICHLPRLLCGAAQCQDSGVRLNDVIFAGHAFCITLLTLMQICSLSGDKVDADIADKGGQGGDKGRDIVRSSELKWIPFRPSLPGFSGW